MVAEQLTSTAVNNFERIPPWFLFPFTTHELFSFFFFSETPYVFKFHSLFSYVSRLGFCGEIRHIQ